MNTDLVNLRHFYAIYSAIAICYSILKYVRVKQMHQHTRCLTHNLQGLLNEIYVPKYLSTFFSYISPAEY